MTDLTDDHFLENIRKNPDDDLARLIYADWLEEQGNERSQTIRLFDEAAAGDVSAFYFLLEETGHFWDSFQQLDPIDQVHVAVDCTLQFNPLILHNTHAVEFLKVLWTEASDEERVGEALTTYRDVRSEVLPEVSLLGECVLDGSDYSLIFGHLIRRSGADRDSVMRTQHLIMLSYYLFGANVLSDSFERSGHV